MRERAKAGGFTVTRAHYSGRSHTSDSFFFMRLVAGIRTVFRTQKDVSRIQPSRKNTEAPEKHSSCARTASVGVRLHRQTLPPCSSPRHPFTISVSSGEKSLSCDATQPRDATPREKKKERINKRLAVSERMSERATRVRASWTGRRFRAGDTRGRHRDAINAPSGALATNRARACRYSDKAVPFFAAPCVTPVRLLHQARAYTQTCVSV